MRECADIERRLSRYLDKEMNDADRAMVEAHLAGCPLCKKEMSELARLKGLVMETERKTLPRDYLVCRIRESIADERRAIGRLSLAGMGIFARRLIPVPVAVIIVSVVFMIFTSMQPVTKSSLEDYIFSGRAATTETALELILGSQN
ncbi:MAG: zf-HC2 domain-containing protein [Candidatus Omnitrophota bacterium]|jgi:anti-sigma factor RsiW|nr:zf-HC2 domain-containing protein [Candidatus Omnitrophota bacterium]